jgi:hypothetical protein
VREDGVVHVLKEEGGGVQGVEGYAVWSVVVELVTGAFEGSSVEAGRTALRDLVAPSSAVSLRCMARDLGTLRGLWRGWRVGRWI